MSRKEEVYLILGLVLAMFGCIGGWLALPQIQAFLAAPTAIVGVTPSASPDLEAARSPAETSSVSPSPDATPTPTGIAAATTPTPAATRPAIPDPSPTPPVDIPVEAPEGSLPGRIVFTAEWDGDDNIYVANADGSQPTNLTKNDMWGDKSPTWSPDGSRIAFVSRIDGNREIYMMNADGTGLTNLTETSADEDQPQWLPDGSRIAFRSGMEIHTINTDGTGRSLVVKMDDYILDFRVSPDGTKVAFITSPSEERGKHDLAVVNIDGSQQTILGEAQSYYVGVTVFSWSPDSLRIAAVAEFDERDDLYTIKADGTDMKLITHNSSTEHSPVWSPDGERIYYYDNRQNTSAILVANPDKPDEPVDTIMTNVPGYHFDISPDGKWIILIGYYHSGTKKSVFVVSTQGSAPTEIVTDLSKWDNHIDWHLD